MSEAALICLCLSWLVALLAAYFAGLARGQAERQTFLSMATESITEVQRLRKQLNQVHNEVEETNYAG